MRRFLLLLLLLPHLALAAASAAFTSPQGSVRLVSAANAATAGQVQLGLEFSLRPGWHIYWQNPGDAGFAPHLTADAPETFGPFTYPPPQYLAQGPVGDYVLSGHVLLPFIARNMGASVTAHAQWLVCADICIPQHADFSFALPGGPAPEAALFTSSPIVPSPFAASLAPDGTLSLTGPGPAQVSAAHFFPLTPGNLTNAAPQPLAFTATGLTLKLALAQPSAALPGILELTDPAGNMQALSLTPTQTAPARTLPLLLLAFLGGLVLNLMPCVFPILALKTCAFARLGGAAHGHIRREALGYTLGVLVSLLGLAGLLLALRAAGAEIFWGFQFQSPAFVAFAGWVILAAGLNFAGLFAVTTPRFIRHIPAQNSFFTGLLAVLVASPCTAPFMAPAVAAALALPALGALGVFAFLGFGLAAPILLLALVPHWAARLPRPGAWMLVLQRALALPMFATFAWLAWVLFHQSGLPGLVLMLGGALFLLLILRRIAWLGLLVLALLPLLHAAPPAPLTLPGAAPYSAAALARLRAAHQPVFIDLTAAWCVTCLVNEQDSLLTPTVQAAFAAHHVQLLLGDWTSRDPAISALLAANHRAGVPLYLYYGPDAATPVILPQILTPGLVTAALQR